MHRYVTCVGPSCKHSTSSVPLPARCRFVHHNCSYGIEFVSRLDFSLLGPSTTSFRGVD